MSQKWEGCCARFEGGEQGPHLTQCGVWPRSTSVPSGVFIRLTSNTMSAYLRTKWHLDLSSHLATTDMGQNWVGVCSLFSGGSWDPIEHNVAWAEAYLRAKWHLDLSSHLATTGMGRKEGGYCAPFGAGSWVHI